MRCTVLLIVVVLVALSPFGGLLSTEPSQKIEYRGAREPSTNLEAFGKGVRDQDWRTPEDEAAGFHLPPGFEVNLFAAEPEINKPLNMAWDHQGRLWITNTVEYPYPAKDSAKARDSIKILEDTTGDGKADKITTFADGLNIPMGLLPVEDGVICFSIPYLWHLKDTDGDDQVDERVKLLGPFDTTRDTHGMINALRRSADGWIYACHGFNNRSRVKAADGSEVYLQSGNTFRFRPDGSRIEQFTKGQVNPFGITRDEFGNWYTADCHSKPITALLPGGCYSSFGRPDDGLGFAPEMMSHLHGSTAICGLHYLQNNSFPEAYQKLFYSGNVMTSRINCNRLIWQGSTAKAKELPDFLTSDDTWFRPVDIQVGHDGALYVADFYNKIIGHYEVDLEHPGRDRTSGRIWRITYTGASAASRALPTASEILGALESACYAKNETLIEAEIHKLVLNKEVRLSEQLLELASVGPGERLRLACWQLLAGRGELTDKAIAHLRKVLQSGQPQNEQLLAGLVRLAANWPQDTRRALLPAVRILLEEANSQAESQPQVARACVEFLASTGDGTDVDRLFRIVELSSDKDPALGHMAKIASRNILRVAEHLGEYSSLYTNRSGKLPGPQLLKPLIEIAKGVDTPEFAVFLLKQLEMDESRSAMAVSLNLAMSHPNVMNEHADRFGRLLFELASEDAETASQILSEATHKLNDLGKDIPQDFRRTWAALFEKMTPERLDAADRWTDEAGRDWLFQERKNGNGDSVQVRSSHALGESYVGTLVSAEFEFQSDLGFLLVGHNGVPAQPSSSKNFVRIIDARNGLELARRYPPRSDIAVTVGFPELKDLAGTRVRLEVVDTDSSGAYAWIAVGGFSIQSMNQPNTASGGKGVLANLIACSMATGNRQKVLELASQLPAASMQRGHMMQLLAESASDQRLAALIDVALQLRRPDLIRNGLVDSDKSQIQDFAKSVAMQCDVGGRQVLARELLASRKGAEQLVLLISQGALGSDCLRDVSLPKVGIASADRDFLESLQGSIEEDGGQLKVLQSRRERLNLAKANHEAGSKVFSKQCANCHQLNGQGKTIGPQLDGAISRSVERLLEDILAPNINVDSAFRQSTLLLDNDSILSGLIQENGPDVFFLIGNDGSKRTVRKEAVVQRRDTKQSLMPANFGDLLNDEQLADLLLYLKATQLRKE